MSRSAKPNVSGIAPDGSAALPTTEAAGEAPIVPDRSWYEVAMVGAGGLCVALAWVVELRDWPGTMLWIFAGLSALLTSQRTSRRALKALGERRIDVDTLMFVAAIGAAAIDHAVEGAFLLFLFGLGAAGEHMALDRAERSLKHLESLVPETAERDRGDGTFEMVTIDVLRVGDRVRVRSFERIACDGIVIEGQTAIDESTLTGEAMPVEKKVGSEVFAGTLNTGSAFVYEASRPAAESALARVVHVVTEARSKRASIEMLTERIGRVYAPCVLGAAALLFAVPVALGYEAAVWFYRSMAFLTAASPCALVIGAPATYLCAIASGARHGIVFKGGESVERLSRVKAFAFDKTGTITQGTPRVHRVLVMEGAGRSAVATEQELLSLAAAVEALATHPLADAIVHEAEERGLELPEVSNARQIAGRGVEAVVGGQSVQAGSPKLIDNQPERSDALQHVAALAAEGCSIVVVTRGQHIIGLIGVRDQVRPDAKAALAALAARGLRLTMLTGDHAGSARVIAAEVGLDEVHAELAPGEKMTWLESIEHETGRVAMVGDGANDAPALARASVSLSMGSAASDVAAENADIAIMGERLMSVAEAHALARRARRIMVQNLVIALGVIATVAPLAAMGYAQLGVAVVLHEGSTVVVVLNALRLLRRWRLKGTLEDIDSPRLTRHVDN